MARRQGHRSEVGHVPGAHDQTARFRVAADLLDHISDLVDGFRLAAGPRSPLVAIYGSELALFVGPLVPNRYAMLVEIANVRIAAEKPQQLVDDRLDVNFLGRDQRETRGQ